MPERSRVERVLPHIESIARRDPDDYVVLAEALHRYLWPDGGLDRRDVQAESWLGRFTRWRSKVGPAPIAPACGCATGRCLVCN